MRRKTMTVVLSIVLVFSAIGLALSVKSVNERIPDRDEVFYKVGQSIPLEYRHELSPVALGNVEIKVVSARLLDAEKLADFVMGDSTAEAEGKRGEEAKVVLVDAELCNQSDEQIDYPIYLLTVQSGLAWASLDASLLSAINDETDPVVSLSAGSTTSVVLPFVFYNTQFKNIPSLEGALKSDCQLIVSTYPTKRIVDVGNDF